MQARCGWPADDELMVAYHDTEWGVPLHDDHKLFEFLLLDNAQTGSKGFKPSTFGSTVRDSRHNPFIYNWLQCVFWPKMRVTSR